MISLTKPALAVGILMGASLANAATVDFIDLTRSGYGESAWAPLTVAIGNVTMTVTAGGAGDNDGQQYAYLDWGNAGLGACKDLRASGATGSNNGAKANVCSRGKDSNVNAGEFLEFVFSQDVVVDNLWFSDTAKGGFRPGDVVYIDGAEYGLEKGLAGGLNGIGTFTVAAGEKLVVAFENRNFHITGIEVTEVPLPGALGLFGLGLAGLAALRRTVRA